MNENKNSFFIVRMLPNMDTAYYTNVNKAVTLIEDMFEPVLGRLNASSETYTIYNPNNFKTITFLFKTITRKRLSLLRNTTNKYFPKAELKNFSSDIERDQYIIERSKIPTVQDVRALTKSQFVTLFEDYKKSPNVKIRGNLMLDGTYVGKDIEVFQNKDNWYEWQKSLYDILYEKFGAVKDANDREIIFIEQSSGNTGKSKFLKYLYSIDPNNIGIIREGNSNQLNSAFFRMMDNQSKKIIFIDLPRTSDSNYLGLANAVESCKNGIVINHMYGANQNVLFDPPHIIICGNKLPEGSFSLDRWLIYTIEKNKKNKPWKDITKEKVKELKKVMELDEAISKMTVKKKMAYLKRLERYLEKSLG